MASPFTITAATGTLELDGRRTGSVSFTVTNTSGRPLTGRAQVKPENAAADGWLTLADEPERPFAVNEAQQYAVEATVPPNAPAGAYPFRLDVVGVENPDELFAQGPAVTMQVAAPLPAKKPFPWWIVGVAAAVVLLVGGLVSWLVFFRGDGDGPRELQSGAFTLQLDSGADLESGKTSATLDAGIDVFLDNRAGQFLVAVNGARIVAASRPGTGEKPLRREECAQLADAGTPPLGSVTLRGADAATRVCVVTNQNNLAEMRYKRDTPRCFPRPPATECPIEFLEVQFTTWER